MRLEPVYLVAPKPKPPSMPTRRAFLLAGGTFAAGSMLGGACGYALGAAPQSQQDADKPEPVALPLTGDADLDELRRLAVVAPMDEFFEKAHMFLGYRAQAYRQDEVLWQGVKRLASEVIDNPSRQVAPPTISAIIAAIEADDATPSADLLALLPALRDRRSRVRQGR